MGLHTVDDDDGPHTHYDASKAHVGIRDHVEELFLKKRGLGIQNEMEGWECND